MISNTHTEVKLTVRWGRMTLEIRTEHFVNRHYETCLNLQIDTLVTGPLNKDLNRNVSSEGSKKKVTRPEMTLVGKDVLFSFSMTYGPLSESSLHVSWRIEILFKKY